MARVVPTALKTAAGFGSRVEIMPPHFEVSASWVAWSFVDWGLGRRREIVLMEVNVSVLRRVVRMWLPTAPVQPKTAAVVMLGVKVKLIIGEGCRR